ncbi:MAG: 3-coathanger stack domain-containing protein, partial [Leadbetterella sp.]
ADYVYVRTRDERGSWSETNRHQVDGFVSTPVSSLVKAEYFFNTDPGYGLATNIPLAVGQTSINDLSFNVPTSSLTAGADFVYVRTRDERGRWSETHRHQVDGQVLNQTPAIVQAEYFFDTDPGYGLGTNINIAAGLTNVPSTAFNVNYGALTTGMHILYVRAKDERGRWSEVATKNILRNSSFLNIYAYPDSVCLGGNIVPKYNTGLSGTQNYLLYLSNAAGSFDQKILLGTKSSSLNVNGVSVTIPSYIGPGENYKIRYQTAASLIGQESDPIVIKNCITGDCGKFINLVGTVDNISGQTITKQSAYAITASNTIVGNSNLTLKSERSILLQPQVSQGFEISGGAVFKAEIGGCL